MKQFYKIGICFLLLIIPEIALAQKFRTEAFSDKVKSLRVQVEGDWESYPVIQLNGGNRIEINFDLLGATQERLVYSTIHCDAEWRQSDLIVTDYLDGFQNRLIEDYAASFNTKMNYTNYLLTFPNNNVGLKISGNYVVQIFREEDMSFPLLTACFSVVETDASVSIDVTPLTDKGMNSFYQAVNFEVMYGNSVKVPMQELKVFVRQNNRLDNEARLVKPLNTQGNTLVFQHNPNLIFEAGNEYRSFEMVTHRHSGLNVDAIEYYSPYYHAILKADRARNHSYLFFDDINGRYMIRDLEATDSDYEADYFFVHFYLPSPMPVNEDIFILSNAFQNILDDRSKMEYSTEDNGYVKTVLLKEGYYNYLYVTKDKSGMGSSARVEGNFYQTDNEYQVYVYFRPQGARYDKLISFESIRYK